MLVKLLWSPSLMYKSVQPMITGVTTLVMNTVILDMLAIRAPGDDVSFVLERQKFVAVESPALIATSEQSFYFLMP